MSTSNVQWKVGQRVKVFTSKTPTPQWITGKIIHQIKKKVCIQFDNHWINCIDTNGINGYEWIHNHDDETIIKDLNQKTVKYSTCNSKMSNFYSIISNEVRIPNPVNEVHRILYSILSIDVSHLKRNEETEIFEIVSTVYDHSDFKEISNYWLIYIESLKQLFVFVNSDILYCDIKCKNQTSYEWNKLG
eukprot:500203_1